LENSFQHEALKAIEEAVALRRQLVNEDPARFNPPLAMSLHKLAVYIFQKCPDKAKKAINESFALLKHLASVSPITFSSALAISRRTRSIIRRKQHENAGERITVNLMTFP
jgi:hypothetical protein